MKASIRQKLAAVAIRQKPPEPEPLGIEKHYTIQQVAEMWGLSYETVRRIFADQKGVLRSGAVTGGRGNRRFTVVRIPESTVKRVHAELAK